MPFAVEIADFSGGLNVGQKLPTQDTRTWTGRDVLVTDSGLLIPRRKAAVGTGTAAGNEAISGTEEAMRAFALRDTSAGGAPVMHLFYMLTTGTPTYTIYQFTDNADGTFTYVRSFTMGDEFNGRVIPITTAGVQYAMWVRGFVGGATLEYVNLSAGGVGTYALAANANPTTLCQWGARLFVASTAVPGRIMYSDPAAFGTWPAGNYIDTSVTQSESISALIPTASALYVAREAGWLVLTGTPTDLNALQVRPLDAGQGLASPPGGWGALSIGGRIFYSGTKGGVFLRERQAVGSRDVAMNVESDEATDFIRRSPSATTSNNYDAGLFRGVEDGFTLGSVAAVPFLNGADGTGTFELIHWRNDRLQRHVLNSTTDGIGGAVIVADGWPGADSHAAIRGFALRDSDNRVAPWCLPLTETRPVYWDGASIEGVWRSAPITGTKPNEPFKVSKVLVEIYKFKTSSETVSTGWGGSCSVTCSVYADWLADISVGNLATPATTAIPWSQTAASVPDDWQRETLVFNVNDLPPSYRVTIQLKLRMVAVRRVVLYADHIGVR